MGRGLVEKGRNGHWTKWECWARWPLGEMKNGRKCNWAKRQKGRTDIGWNGKRAKLERGKKNGRNGKNSGGEWAKQDWANSMLKFEANMNYILQALPAP